MRTYEMMAVFAPDIPEDQMPASLERVSGYVTTAGGEVTELVTTSPWGRRRLAYEILKYRDGFYALYHLNLPPEGINDMERDLKLDAQVIRHLITSYEPPKPKKLSKKELAAQAAQAEAEANGTNAETTDTAPDAAPVATLDPDTAPADPSGVDTATPPTAETPEVEEE